MANIEFPCERARTTAALEQHGAELAHALLGLEFVQAYCLAVGQLLHHPWLAEAEAELPDSASTQEEAAVVARDFIARGDCEETDISTSLQGFVYEALTTAAAVDIAHVHGVSDFTSLQNRIRSLRARLSQVRCADLVADVQAAAAARAQEHPEDHGLEPLLAELEAEQLADGGEADAAKPPRFLPLTWTPMVGEPGAVPHDVESTEVAWHREYWEARRARAEALLAERDLEHAERAAGGGGQ